MLRAAVAGRGHWGPNPVRSFSQLPASEVIDDKGVDFPDAYYHSPGAAASLRVGDVFVPNIEPVEPLRIEWRHSADCIVGGTRPDADGEKGLQMVRVVEAAETCLGNGGQAVPLEAPLAASRSGT